MRYFQSWFLAAVVGFIIALAVSCSIFYGKPKNVEPRATEQATGLSNELPVATKFMCLMLEGNSCSPGEQIYRVEYRDTVCYIYRQGISCLSKNR